MVKLNKINTNEEYFDYDKQKMVYEPSDILNLLNSYLDVVSEQDAKSFFEDMDRYLKGCRKVKSDFRKSKAMRAWKLAEKESSSFNDNDDLDAVMETGLKYTESPTLLLEIGNYFDGNFEPYIGFSFNFKD